MPDRENQGGPDPVSPELYTREYYTSDCEGYEIFLKDAEELPERIREALEKAGDLDGRWVLDIGCGRGELVCEAARKGAHAVGIDYSEAAIEISRQRLEALYGDVAARVEFRQVDAKGLPFPAGSFDVVFMVDVYEHLHPHEIEHALGEIRRVLRPGGMLIVHTGPNTWFYRYGYPPVRTLARLVLRREFPQDLRHESDAYLHVNEQSPLSLYRGLREAGYRARVIPRSFFTGIDPNPWERAAMRVLFARPAGYFFCLSLMAEAWPREGGREAQLRVDRLLRLTRPRRGSRVLLVGECEGMLAGRLAGQVGLEVIWLEPGEGPAREGPASPGRGSGYRWVAGDPCRLPFPAGHFDTVIAQFTLEGLEDPGEALSEWGRVLKQGGVVALVTANALFRGWEPRPGPRPVNRFSPRAMGEAVREAGLEVFHTSTMLPHLRLPALYRGELSFLPWLERLPFLGRRGRLLFVAARKTMGGGAA
ncbi:MAG: methyltransferase domain-containing protein [Actinomycetota bacterium]|nr:methyltransferase domain-containing protein [Actinomycetota bacterium]